MRGGHRPLRATASHLTRTNIRHTGGVGAARNLDALRAAGISHVVNASPLVPCFHKAALRYRVVPVFDDAEYDMAQFF